MVTGLSVLSYGVLTAVYYAHYLEFHIEWMPTKTPRVWEVSVFAVMVPSVILIKR